MDMPATYEYRHLIKYALILAIIVFFNSPLWRKVKNALKNSWTTHKEDSVLKHSNDGSLDLDGLEDFIPSMFGGKRVPIYSSAKASQNPDLYEFAEEAVQGLPSTSITVGLHSFGITYQGQYALITYEVKDADVGLVVIVQNAITVPTEEDLNNLIEVIKKGNNKG